VYPEDSSEVGVAILAEDEEVDRIAEILATTVRSNCLCDREMVILPLTIDKTHDPDGSKLRFE
jgi:hypothetical protein